MCSILAALPAIGAATGATGAAAVATTALQIGGAALAIGGPIFQGIQANRTAKSQARQIETQRQQELVRNATIDQRQRRQFSSQIATQRAELIARGIQLDSPTAVVLGQNAAQELSFESQATRATGQATDQELSFAARSSRARGTQALLSGGFSAAGELLTRAPDLWPELLT